MNKSDYFKIQKLRRSKVKQTDRGKLDEIAEKLGITKQTDWYLVTGSKVAHLGGGTILHKFSNSLLAALRSIYSEFEWNPLLFEGSTSNHWKDTVNQRKMLDSIAESLGIVTQQDWYSVTPKHDSRLNTLLNLYKGSLISALQTLYPEYVWDPLLLPHVPVHSWQNMDNQRKIMDRIGEQMGIDKQEDWYSATTTEVMLRGAEGLISNRYNGSLFAALQAIYPEYSWNPLHFAYPPLNIIHKLDTSVISESLEDMGHWSEVVRSNVFKKVGKRFGGKLNALEMFFPEVDWTHKHYDSKGEFKLESVLKLFSRVERHKNVSGYSLDFYLPNLSLAFEFQGGQHYQPLHKLPHSITVQQDRDRRKKQDLAQLGISVIQVPYWWNGNLSSLINTIHKQLNTDRFMRFQKMYNDYTSSYVRKDLSGLYSEAGIVSSSTEPELSCK